MGLQEDLKSPFRDRRAKPSLAVAQREGPHLGCRLPKMDSGHTPGSDQPVAQQRVYCVQKAQTPNEIILLTVSLIMTL